MKTVLTYYHTRNLFVKNEFKPFVNKYFKNVKFLGTESGNYKPSISVSNWDKVKNKLPKYAIPEIIDSEIKEGVGIAVLRALVNGNLAEARRLRGENDHKHIGTYRY